MSDATIAAETVAARAPEGTHSGTQHVDVAVVGAGFAGLYLLHRLRKAGFSVVGLDEADDVGGTWYWNRYPGARCDIQTIDYSYSFDPELERAWTWSEKYATQPEILRYLGFVADRYDLRRDIRFGTKVLAATWDDATERWLLATSSGASVSCRHYIMATGCLSAPKPPEIEGVKDFKGEVYFTSRWPHQGVDLKGKRVAVIGTGSSGIQSIPMIAEQASHLTVFQRTPNFALPAHNGPAPSDRKALLEQDRAAFREQARWSMAGVPLPPATEFSFQLSDAERRERFEKMWATGDLVGMLTQLWADQGTDPEANALLAELFREKIRSIVKDPETAEALCPTDHPFGSKRPCLDTNYYATFNRPNVTLVNLRKEPIISITTSGITTDKRSVDVDVIVFATGFDAMTGAIKAVHPITGRGGKSLTDVWAHGPQTYLGLTVAGFPNLFLITGPGSPSVLSNMSVSIEQHVDWVVDRLVALREAGFNTMEATETAQAGWTRHMADCATLTLHRLANTWYTGANVPGKPHALMPYTGGVGPYRSICNDIVSHGMLGFRLTGPNVAAQCNDGEIVRLQPDVRLVLGMLAQMNLPTDRVVRRARRARLRQRVQQDPSRGAAGRRGRRRLASRSRRRASLPSLSPGNRRTAPDRGLFPRRRLGAGRRAVRRSVLPRSVPANRHDLCQRRLPPCARTPLPDGGGRRLCGDAMDRRACDRTRRTAGAGHGRGLERRRQYRCRHLPIGARPRRACDRGPASGLPGHRLPLRPSVLHRERDGYFLTRSLMFWFWDLYCSPADRTDPRASPLRGKLEGLPPAYVVTCEFDPLRDEGIAYADAMQAAGVPVEQLKARGHFHSSFTMVDVVLTSAGGRAQMAHALRRFAGLAQDNQDQRSDQTTFNAAAS